jgi:hypothetical protein
MLMRLSSRRQQQRLIAVRQSGRSRTYAPRWVPRTVHASRDGVRVDTEEEEGGQTEASEGGGEG